MPSKVFSCSVIGLDSKLVEIEADVDVGFAKVSIVGLPDASINEAKDRIMSALKNSGFFLPRNKITINLAPADLHKGGTFYDLPMAISILIADDQIKNKCFDDSLFLGELSLDGSLRKVNGVLSAAIFAKESGYKNLFIPYENKDEAVLIDSINVFPIKNFSEIVAHLCGGRKIDQIFFDKSIIISEKIIDDTFDFKYIKGQEQAKRALEICASGGHNILLFGPPGSGKTLLSRSVSTILPDMSMDEILEVSRIYSVAGLLAKDNPLVTVRPFRSPHHSCSVASVVGGGSFPKPGEISLSHRGVLFLDEFPEFSKTIIESLRQPLEDYKITISRAKKSLDFPAKFMLIATANPCPCGYLNDINKHCTCSALSVLKYKNKLSGPIVDRIDMFIEVPRIKFEKLSNNDLACDSITIKNRVSRAIYIQQERFKNDGIVNNSEMKHKHIKKYCALKDDSLELLKKATSTLNLSARGYSKILKLSRTIADMDGKNDISIEHVSEALQYRKRE